MSSLILEEESSGGGSFCGSFPVVEASVSVDNESRVVGLGGRGGGVLLDEGEEGEAISREIRYQPQLKGQVQFPFLWFAWGLIENINATAASVRCFCSVKLSA